MVETQQKTFITETNDACRTTERSKEESGRNKRRRRRKQKNPIPYSMRENPELNHPSLTRGQRKFLGSIATVYSTENMKRSIEEQYVRQLLYEKDKGIIKGADWYKYLDYFCQSSKRKHLFQPASLPPRSIKSRKLRTRADIHRPILAPLPPIPSSVSQNIRSSKRSSLANSQNATTPRYVTTIRRNESIPDVSFKNDPIETNITVIGDEDSHKSSQTLSTISTSKDSSEITETTITFPSEVSKDTGEKDAVQEDSTTEMKADNESVSQNDDQDKAEVSEIATNDEKEKKDDDKETEEKSSSESSEKIEKNETVEDRSSDKESVDDVESSGETVIEKTTNEEEEEITPNNHEKDKDDVEDAQDEEQNAPVRKASVSSTNETSTNDEPAEKATSSGKATSDDDGAETAVEEDVSLGEPTTNLLTLLGQPDEDSAPLQGEGITRPKSRIGNRPSRSPV